MNFSGKIAKLSPYVCKNKLQIIITALITAGLLIFDWVTRSCFVWNDPILGYPVYHRKCLLLILILIGISGVLSLVRFSFSERFHQIFRLVLFLLTPLVIFITMSFGSNYSLRVFFQYANCGWVLLFNYLLQLAILTITYVICNRVRLSILINTILFTAIGILNGYIILFRLIPICPWDLYSLKTAAAVAGEYQFTPNHQSIMAISVLLFWCVLTAKIQQPKRSFQWKSLIRRIAMIIPCIVLFVCIYCTNMLKNVGITPWLWQQDINYESNGFTLAFTMNVQYLFITTPSHYSVDAVKNITNSYQPSATVFSEQSDESTRTPDNIIVVMSESFSDFSVLGDLQTNEDPFPFIHSLKENTISGYVNVSVMGGGTANSEFEFLTGNTMSFLPTGSIAYQQYFSSEIPSLVSILNDQGYTSYAVHPHKATNWNREKVYSCFGFKDFFSLEDFTEYAKCGYHPSDQSNYQYLIDLYEHKKPGEKLFLFDVSMQNHGPYTYEGDYYDRERIKITNLKGNYPRAEQFMSLMRVTDEDTKNLIEYFQKQDENTIIVFFGDHMPGVEEEFYEELQQCKTEDLTLSQRMQRYKTPFFIWANYDIPEKQGLNISVNYLSCYLLKAADLQTTPYLEFLENQSQILPIITGIGYVDADGDYYSWKEDSEQYYDQLNNYHILEYNHMFGKKKRVENVFSSIIE